MQDFLFFKIEKAYIRLWFSEILYIQAENKYATIVTPQRSFLTLSSMNHIEKMLPSELFCRIHRSYIVSLGHICRFDNELVYIGDKKIPLAEQYKNVLKNSVIIINGDGGNHNQSNNLPTPAKPFTNKKDRFIPKS
jgi:DNA-binding LytR/AlgR family response regulator